MASSPLRSVIGLAMVATTSALAADAADDALVFRAVTRRAADVAFHHPAVHAALGGPPLARGSLWATTLSAPYRSDLARATFDVAGPSGVRTEVSVLAARAGAGQRGGRMRAPSLWGRWSADGWTVLHVRAALPGPVAGPVRGVSLLAPPPDMMEREAGEGGSVDKVL
jgi:hypothetical protein